MTLDFPRAEWCMEGNGIHIPRVRERGHLGSGSSAPEGGRLPESEPRGGLKVPEGPVEDRGLARAGKWIDSRG